LITDDVMTLEPVSREDRDSIHTLAVSALPVRSPGLKRTRLVKNVHLENRLEMFSGSEVGSGQISVSEIPNHFEDSEDLRADIKMLEGLAVLPSFDCYTLRRGLRQQGLKIEQDEIFKLSDEKVQELFPFMRRITRPLIKHLYGDENLDINDTNSLLELVQNPDLDRVKDRLDQLSQTLGVSLRSLPAYLEDFGDLFLSLSYFEELFVEMRPKVDQMILWSEDVATSSHLRNDPMSQKSFEQSNRRIIYVRDNLAARFNGLSESTTVNWESMSLKAFEKVQRGISANQIYLAIGLCGLSVKLLEWERRFPNAGGSPDRCLEFVSGDLMPGLDNLVRAMPRAEPEKRDEPKVASSGRVW